MLPYRDGHCTSIIFLLCIFCCWRYCLILLKIFPFIALRVNIGMLREVRCIHYFVLHLHYPLLLLPITTSSHSLFHSLPEVTFTNLTFFYLHSKCPNSIITHLVHLQGFVFFNSGTTKSSF